MAAAASSGLVISTKPKPRDRPVSRSSITEADSTAPACEKSSRSSSLVVRNERFPTNSFVLISFPSSSKAKRGLKAHRLKESANSLFHAIRGDLSPSAQIVNPQNRKSFRFTIFESYFLLSVTKPRSPFQPNASRHYEPKAGALLFAKPERARAETIIQTGKVCRHSAHKSTVFYVIFN
jgi:hypothetical protein